MLKDLNLGADSRRPSAFEAAPLNLTPASIQTEMADREGFEPSRLREQPIAFPTRADRPDSGNDPKVVHADGIEPPTLRL